ncbi:MAG: Crp/Fnr family transcriptional regulator, partial [Pseudomonadota bacterium]
MPGKTGRDRGASMGLLASLDGETRAAVEARLSARDYAGGEEIVSYLNVERDIFFMLSGSARVKIYAETGKVVDYRTIQAGDMFGEVAAIDGGPRSASVIAEGPSRVGRLRHGDFERLCIEVPVFNQAVLVHLTDIIRRLTERVLEFSVLPGARRLVLEIVRLAEETGAESGRVALENVPTHHEIAARISSHREAVSR